MSLKDPGKPDYPQTYQPPMPVCAREGCGDMWSVHLPDPRRPHGRGRCSRWGRRQRCECTAYIPSEQEGGTCG